MIKYWMMGLLMLGMSQSWAVTRYVSLVGSDTAPYLTEGAAARTIQDAVDVAVASDIVLVADGVYTVGTTTRSGGSSESRVSITKKITVRSLNPFGATIQGTDKGGAFKNERVRCVYMTLGELDGFVLRNGYSLINSGSLLDQSGGGVLVEGSAIVKNCRIENCEAAGGGGASGAVLKQCVLSGNIAVEGTLIVGMGGGVRNSTLTDCTIEGNTSRSGAGCARSTLTDCVLSNNVASHLGGGGNVSTLTRCVVIGNSAQYGAGAYGSTLTECEISENSATYNGGGVNDSGVTNCTMIRNRSDYGAGGYDSSLTDCQILENRAVYDGGGADKGILTRCTILNNEAGYDGGGVCDSTVNRCFVSGNKAGDTGGGAAGSSSSLKNCVLSGNRAGTGGGSFQGTLTYCTVVGNCATNTGGGAVSNGLWNCIVSQNLPNDLVGVSANGTCSPDVTHGSFSCITNAPEFADQLFHLRSSSPCIDAGLEISEPLDYDGFPRALDGDNDSVVKADMGAFEYAGMADYDSDGVSDRDEAWEYGSNLDNMDSDGDGRLDGDEVSAGLQPGYDEGPAITLGEENVTDDPASFELYTEQSIRDANLGKLVVEVVNNQAVIQLQPELSVDLANNIWTNDGAAAKVWVIDVNDGASFYRVRGE